MSPSPLTGPSSRQFCPPHPPPPPVRSLTGGDDCTHFDLLWSSQSREDKLLAFHHRALDIIRSSTKYECDINLPSIINQIKACQMVRNCLDGNVCSNFMNYFEINAHERSTRNSGYQLKLPKIRLEYSRRSFYNMGAKLYNDLPLNIRKAEDHKSFNKLLKGYF